MVGPVTGGFDFSNHFIRLSSNISADLVDEAKKQVAVLAWGKFPRRRVNFVIIAWVLFIIVYMMNQNSPPLFNIGLPQRAFERSFVLLVLN